MWSGRQIIKDGNTEDQNPFSSIWLLTLENKQSNMLPRQWGPACVGVPEVKLWIHYWWWLRDVPVTLTGRRHAGEPLGYSRLSPGKHDAQEVTSTLTSTAMTRKRTTDSSMTWTSSLHSSQQIHNEHDECLFKTQYIYWSSQSKVIEDELFRKKVQQQTVRTGSSTSSRSQYQGRDVDQNH